MDKEKVLQEIGLKKPEIKIYLALLELDESSISKIVNKTNMQKSAVYFYLKNLINLGLVSYVRQNNIKYFKAVEPKRIQEIMEDKLKKVEKIIPELESLSTKKEKETEASIFKGYTGFKSVIENQFEVCSKGDTICVINLSDVQPLEKYKILWHNFELKRVKKGIHFKVLTNVKFKKIIKKEYKKYKLREDRFLDLGVPSAIVVYKNFVEIHVYKKPSAHLFIFLIKDEEIAESFKNYFELLWKQAKP